jgi:hypothetical protein
MVGFSVEKQPLDTQTGHGNAPFLGAPSNKVKLSVVEHMPGPVCESHLPTEKPPEAQLPAGQLWKSILDEFQFQGMQQPFSAASH